MVEIHVLLNAVMVEKDVTHVYHVYRVVYVQIGVKKIAWLVLNVMVIMDQWELMVEINVRSHVGMMEKDVTHVKHV